MDGWTLGPTVLLWCRVTEKRQLEGNTQSLRGLCGRDTHKAAPWGHRGGHSPATSRSEVDNRTQDKRQECSMGLERPAKN